MIAAESQSSFTSAVAAAADESVLLPRGMRDGERERERERESANEI